MNRLSALLAGWLLYAVSVTATGTACRSDWTEIRNTNPGVVLAVGIDSFKVGQPAPRDLLEKIGALLCAAGSEELRVIDVGDRSYFGDPARHAERVIRFAEFIHGREVRLSTINISLNIETNRVATIYGTFLSARNVDREPRLTAAQAKAKVEARMRTNSHIELSPVSG